MISPAGLLATVGLTDTRSVTWGTPVPTAASGVYVVSLRPEPDDGQGIPTAPIDKSAVAAWIARVPHLKLDGNRPTPEHLMARLSQYWLPDESIVYIGKATSLRGRVRQYYTTPLGDKRPHAGGHWIKTLSILPQLSVHYTEVGRSDPEELEKRLLLAFRDALSGDAPVGYPDSDLVLPFANLEIRGIGRRNHGISGSVLR